MTVTEAIDAAFAVGMHQHRDEIFPFAQWLAKCDLVDTLEIGMLHGGTATLWHHILRGIVVSIDLPDARFGGGDHGYTVERCIERNNRLHAALPGWHGILDDSHAMRTWGLAKRNRYDFLFIDGDHTLIGATMDYAMYRPLVRPGGVIAFHDIKDTALHREAGCYVHELWAWIKQTPQREVREFIGADTNWGGIGAIVV